MEASPPAVKSSSITRWLSIAGILAQLFLYASVVKPPSETKTITRRRSYGLGWTSLPSSMIMSSWLHARSAIRQIGSGKVLLLCVVLATRTYLISASKALLVFVETKLGGWTQAGYLAAFFSSVVLYPVLHPTSIASERLARMSSWMWNQTVMQIWRLALRGPSGVIATFVGRVFILPVLRLWLDYPMWLYHYWWFHHGTGHLGLAFFLFFLFFFVFFFCLLMPAASNRKL